jgi:membrane protein
VYLQYITRTGYTYGALATPIAFLLFAFFLGFAIMIGAELNAAIQEEWPAPQTHLTRWRARWRAGKESRAEVAEPAEPAEEPQPVAVRPS